MNDIVVTLALDAVLATLLVTTISYCSRLSQRIRLLQDSRGELASMIAQFDQATGRAAVSLAELQTTSKKITDALQLKIEKANFLADDLAFLIEKGTKIATQMEHVRTTRPEVTATQPKSFLPSSPATPSLSSSPPKAVASLEAVLQRLAVSTNTASPSRMSSPPITEPQSVPRTHAERELLEALKTGR